MLQTELTHLNDEAESMAKAQGSSIAPTQTNDFRHYYAWILAALEDINQTIVELLERLKVRLSS